MHRLALSVRDRAKQFLKPPETVPDPTTISAAEEQQETHEGIPQGSALPGWLIGEWRAIHAIEPQLFPDPDIRVNVVTDFISPSQVGTHYLALCESYGREVTHVFLVPWLKRGGADLVCLNYVQALLEHSLGGEVVVITTEDADSPWAQKLHPNARLIEFGKNYAHLTAEEQEKLLVRVLLQMAPKVVHVINSFLGYRTCIKYGKALAKRSRLFASAFCEDITPEGRSIGYPICFLPECFDCLTAVFTDNRFIVDRLCGLFAFEEDKFQVHYQPVSPFEMKASSVKDIDKKSLDVLWASRLDVQKRPDILIRIAEMCHGLPFVFHVYGSPVFGTSDTQADSFVSSLGELSNVRYYGGFDGLLSLPLDRYDLLLYTSQWDGLPNVLLEAASAGLPILASKVGGIPDLIVHGESGFLVAPYDDVGEYVTSLQRIHLDRTRLPHIVKNARSIVAERHSWVRFARRLEETSEYVVPTCTEGPDRSALGHHKRGINLVEGADHAM
ncbi:MAG: glycosyltransferase family 4 protein [Chloroflexota bacterium]